MSKAEEAKGGCRPVSPLISSYRGQRIVYKKAQRSLSHAANSTLGELTTPARAIENDIVLLRRNASVVHGRGLAILSTLFLEVGSNIVQLRAPLCNVLCRMIGSPVNKA